MVKIRNVKRKQKNQAWIDKQDLERRLAFHYVRLTTRVCDEFVIENPPYRLCSRCGKVTSKGYHYKKSNIGEIWLCQACNFKVRHPGGQGLKIIYTPMGNKR